MFNWPKGLPIPQAPSASVGAQGRNRTTDTAIFSRMLYQLSYLGTVRRGPGAPVYSQAGLPCPPRFACATRGAAPRGE